MKAFVLALLLGVSLATDSKFLNKNTGEQNKYENQDWVALNKNTGEQNKYENQDWVSLHDINIVVNDTKIEMIVGEMQASQQLQEQAMQEYLQDVGAELEQAYNNLLGKLILNFGENVVPQLQRDIDVLQYFAVNDDCDTDCAASCFDPLGEPMPFDNACMQLCGCTWNFETADPNQIGADFQAYEEGLQTTQASNEAIAQDFAQDIQPAMEKFMQVREELRTDFNTRLTNIAVNEFGCDPVCVADCCNQEFIGILIVPTCIKYCTCTSQAITIEATGEYDYSALLQFSNYNKDAWSFFMSKKDSYVQ